jgi:hypothetical protein
MRKRVQDLLICHIVCEHLAIRVAEFFRAKYPRIRIRIEEMNSRVMLSGKIRFRAAVVVTNTDHSIITGVVTNNLVKLGYSPKNTFVLNTSRTYRYSPCYLIHGYNRDQIDQLIEAAKEGAYADPDCCWQTTDEVESEEKLTLKRRLLGNRWVAKFIRLVGRR